MNDSGARLVLLPNPNAWVVCFNSITVKPHSAPPAATHHPANAPAHCGLAGGTQKLLVLPRGSPALCFTGLIRCWVRLENTFRRQHLNEHIYPIYVGSSFLTLRPFGSHARKAPITGFQLRLRKPASLALPHPITFLPMTTARHCFGNDHFSDDKFPDNCPDGCHAKTHFQLFTPFVLPALFDSRHWGTTLSR
jgi:hypothetical protein